MQINKGNDNSVIQFVISNEELNREGFEIDSLVADDRLKNVLLTSILSIASQIIPINFDKILSPISMYVADNKEFIIIEVNFDVEVHTINTLDEQVIPENLDNIYVFLKVRKFDVLSQFSGILNHLFVSDSILYKYKDAYYMYMELNCSDINYLNAIYNLIYEFSDESIADTSKEFLDEHGQILIHSKALETIQAI